MSRHKAVAGDTTLALDSLIAELLESGSNGSGVMPSLGFTIRVPAGHIAQ